MAPLMYMPAFRLEGTEMTTRGDECVYLVLGRGGMET